MWWRRLHLPSFTSNFTASRNDSHCLAHVGNTFKIRLASDTTLKNMLFIRFLPPPFQSLLKTTAPRWHGCALHDISHLSAQDDLLKAWGGCRQWLRLRRVRGRTHRHQCPRGGQQAQSQGTPSRGRCFVSSLVIYRCSAHVLVQGESILIFCRWSWRAEPRLMPRLKMWMRRPISLWLRSIHR